MVLFAATGISARSRSVARGAADVRGRVVEQRQKNDSAPGLLQPQIALIERAWTSRTVFRSIVPHFAWISLTLLEDTVAADLPEPRFLLLWLVNSEGCSNDQKQPT